ncbi:MAG: DUF2806 domain-containing protein [Desulfuromonadaceae bacterium]|nr:DUF2806 domain-containing protein [Desulfuromonadaceae bacterium]MDD2850218.1 DUF2806 domain-containing protein [Desulfuromonadaceae bacterium]
MDYPGEKLLLKLWDTLAEKGIGSLLKPWQEKRVARARHEIRREELLTLAQAKKEVEAIKSGKAVYSKNGEVKLLSSPLNEMIKTREIEQAIDQPSFVLRATEIDISETVRKEVNVAKAIMIAEDILEKDSQEPPEASIEDDWLFSWREYAGKVSSDELQDLWGRVLAGETKQPGSYSIRTLDFLKNLSKPEAELISKAAKFVIAGRIFRKKESFLEKEGLFFSQLLHLQDIGVLSGVEAVGLTAKYKSLAPDKYFNPLVASNKVILIEHEDSKKEVTSEVYLLTGTGREVLKLASFQVDPDYLESVANDFAGKGLKVSVADWLQVTSDSGQYYNAKEIST